MSAPGEMEISSRRKGPLAALSRFSVVWLVPLAALILALVIAWSAISSRGPLIEISFSNAEGMTPGTTPLKYREVNVGKVERLRFSDDLSEVIVSVRIDKDVARFIDADALFWIVRPEVTARGVSGLSTVLSGVYIQGDWDSEPGAPAHSFEGLDGAPLHMNGQEGTEITLRAQSAGRLMVGAPIIHKGITVGHMADPELTENGDAVTAKAFINAPYDRFVTSTTRFWSASGFSLSLGPTGLTLDIGSLASLVEGGVGFSNIVSGGQVIETGHVFNVFPDEETARSAAFDDADAYSVPFTVNFDQALSGLANGAPVEYHGLRVGSVTSLGAVVVGEGADQTVEMHVQIGLQPGRLGLAEDASAEATADFLANRVEQGLRARLAGTGLLSTSLKIELVQIPDAPAANLDPDGDPHPVIPTAPAQVPDVAAAAQGVLTRIRDLPIEQIVQQVSEVLINVNRVLASDGVQQAPQAALALIDDARNLIGSEEIAEMVTEAQGAIGDLRRMLAQLQESAAITTLLTTLDHVESVAASVDTASEGLPDLIGDIREVTAKAQTLPLQELVQSTTDLIDTANGLIGSEETAQLPAALTAALDELALALADLREGGAVGNVNQTLDSTRAAAASIEEAAARLPELSARIDALSANANALLTAYGNNSAFNQQTLSALRDLRDAARAVTALARTLERNPDALLRGR